MKKVKLFIMAAAALCLVACGEKKSAEVAPADSTNVVADIVAKPDQKEEPQKDTVSAEELAKQQAEEAAKAEAVKQQTAEIAFIKSFYQKHVFGDSQSLTKKCTRSLLNKMAAAYDMDGGGYATWIFRSNAMDGSGASRVKSVTPQGNGWYRVKMSDMGHPCTKRVHVVNNNGVIQMNNVK